MTEPGENVTLEDWISFKDQDELQVPFHEDGELIYDVQAGLAGVLINSSRGVYLRTWDEDELKMSGCANDVFNRSDIFRFYVSKKAYLVTLDGKQFEVYPNVTNASFCDIEPATFDNTTCEGYEVATGINGLNNLSSPYWTQLQVRRHEQTCVFWPIFTPRVSGTYVAISQLLTSATKFFELSGPAAGVSSIAYNGSWTFYVISDGTVQLTTDIYLDPVNVSEHPAWPMNGEDPVLVRQVAFASDVFIFLGADNTTIFRMTDPLWNGTHARDIALDDIYDLSKLNITFDMEQIGGVIQRYNGTSVEVLGQTEEEEKKDENAQNPESPETQENPDNPTTDPATPLTADSESGSSEAAGEGTGEGSGEGSSGDSENGESDKTKEITWTIGNLLGLSLEQ